MSYDHGSAKRVKEGREQRRRRRAIPGGPEGARKDDADRANAEAMERISRLMSRR